MKLVSKRSEEITFLLILFFYRELFTVDLSNLVLFTKINLKFFRFANFANFANYS